MCVLLQITSGSAPSHVHHKSPPRQLSPRRQDSFLAPKDLEVVLLSTHQHYCTTRQQLRVSHTSTTAPHSNNWGWAAPTLLHHTPAIEGEWHQHYCTTLQQLRVSDTSTTAPYSNNWGWVTPTLLHSTLKLRVSDTNTTTPDANNYWWWVTPTQLHHIPTMEGERRQHYCTTRQQLMVSDTNTTAPHANNWWWAIPTLLHHTPTIKGERYQLYRTTREHYCTTLQQLRVSDTNTPASHVNTTAPHSNNLGWATTLHSLSCLYPEWPHRQGGCLACCGCTFGSRAKVALIYTVHEALRGYCP